MKKSIFLLVFMAIVSVGAFTQSLFDSSSNNPLSEDFSANLLYLPISPNTNIFTNNAHINFSPFSAGDAKRAEETMWLAFALNLALGFGIGSFVQGDIDGGLISVLGTVGGYALIIVGSMRMSAGLYDDGYYGDNYYYGDGYGTMADAGLLIAGALVLIGTKIFEALRPFAYVDSFSVAFNPGIDVNGQPTFAVVGKVAY